MDRILIKTKDLKESKIQTFLIGYRGVTPYENDYAYYLLKPSEKVLDNKIVDVSAEYNLQQREQYINIEINEIENSLSESDYKITKCYEASLLNEELPYNIEQLHEERQAKRDRINELRNLLTKK